MISIGFERVSKKRPCRICGKPTYCGFSRDEGTSICMRISAGSRGLSRNGGNIHVHPEIPFITIRPRIQRPLSQSIRLASLEIRDAVFRELIRISPASNYRQELVTCPGGLLSRGLLEEHATSCGALPRTKRKRATLAGILNDYVSARFPAYAQSHSRSRRGRRTRILAGTIWRGPHLEISPLSHAASGNNVQRRKRIDSRLPNQITRK